MRHRLLGQSGLRVSEVFLGAMIFGDAGGGTVSPDRARRILDVYDEAGGNVVDTAVNYAAGQSETIVGELLEGRRDRFVLSTKYAITRDPTDPNAAGSHRKNLTRSLETSLRRLRTDHIDLYWVHFWDHHTPIEATMRALDDAVRAGKILHVGISDAPAWVVARANTLAEWRDWTPFAGVQVPYNLLDRDVERELLPMAATLGLSVVAWGPLAHGMLAGSLTRPDGPDPDTRIAAGSADDRQLAVARTVQQVADDLGATPAQVAIAWTMTRFPRVHPLVGASSAAQLADSLGAVDLHLDDDTRERLEDAAPFRAGFPTDFLAGAGDWIYGNVAISDT